MPPGRPNLGFRCANGRGVPQDDVQAYMWLNLGSARMTREDRESAVKSRDVVAERMTPERIGEAQRLAHE